VSHLSYSKGSQRLLEALNQRQNELIDIAEKFKGTLKIFKEISVEYCEKYCPNSKGVKTKKVQKIPCDGAEKLNIQPCKNYEKQNEFWEMSFLLLSILRGQVERIEAETGL